MGRRLPTSTTRKSSADERRRTCSPAMRRGGSRPVRRAMSAVVIHWRGRLTIREGTLVLQEWPDSPYTIMIYGNKPPLSSLIDWSPSKLPGN
jgi:hypothetical protein